MKMIEYILLGIGVIVIIFGIYLFCSLKVINQYERGVKFTLGKFAGVLNPGLHVIFEGFETLKRVDIRQNVLKLPAQEVMTKDQVNLTIDGVVFYNVNEPARAVINVADIDSQLIAKSTSELKEILGNKTMKECLSDRTDIAKRLKNELDISINDSKDGTKGNKAWGIMVNDVQINNINLPQELTRAMAKAAEAMQEKEARLTKAEGEKQAATKLMEAAQMYGTNPTAMRLRELQTYQEIGSERNTLMMVIPSRMLDSETAAIATSVAASKAMNISQKSGKK
jgi:regulator of protease activity HflC (stomatin/prohibitin superfamily)